MPHPEFSHLYQAAVLWPIIGRDAYAQPLMGSPIELRVRWTDVRAVIKDAQGNTITIDATVIVPQDITLDSEMWLGALDDLPGTSGAPVQDVMIVKSLNFTPDIRNRVTFRQVSLSRKSNVV